MITRSLYTTILLLSLFLSNSLLVLCRIHPGCSLIQSTIYCYGGFKRINNASYYSQAINDHISLDLSTVFDLHLKRFNTSNIQWKNVSNRLDHKKLKRLGNTATVTLTDHTYLLYGGSINSKPQLSPSSSSSFLQYQPQDDNWYYLPFYKAKNAKINDYNIRPDLVNFGKNIVWIWGNSAYNNDSSLFYLYNYQTSTWFYQGIGGPLIRYDHSTTFVKKNGLIYIMGGYSLKESKGIDFHSILIFNTTSLDWSTLNVKGDVPSNRGSHTTIESSDQNYLLIYGGSFISNNEVFVTQDVYYVYDIVNNTFTNVPLGSEKTYTRFGHFATVYQSNYLVLVFGFQDKDKPNDQVTILDVTHPFQPGWILPTSLQNSPPSSSFISSIPTSTNTNVNNNSNNVFAFEGDILKKTIISVSVIAIVAIFTGIFLFIRYKKRKQRLVPITMHEEEQQRMIDDPLTIDKNKKELNDQQEKAKMYIPTTSTKNVHH